MRLVNPLGRLSRATAGTRRQRLILNTPGSSEGSAMSAGGSGRLPHALELLAGEHPHAGVGAIHMIVVESTTYLGGAVDEHMARAVALANAVRPGPRPTRGSAPWS